jgi:hypothetical protein
VLILFLLSVATEISVSQHAKLATPLCWSEREPEVLFQCPQVRCNILSKGVRESEAAHSGWKVEMKVEPTGSTAPHAPTREPSYLPDEALSRVAKRRHNPIQLPHDALRCIIDPRVRWGGLPVPGSCSTAVTVPC